MKQSVQGSSQRWENVCAVADGDMRLTTILQKNSSPLNYSDPITMNDAATRCIGKDRIRSLVA